MPVWTAVRGQVLPGWMSRDVALLLTARTTMSTGRALAGVTLPVYLATLGYSGAQLGILFALTSIFSGTAAVLVGLLSDRVGRKLFVVIIPLVTGICALGVGAANETVWIFAFAVTATIGQG